MSGTFQDVSKFSFQHINELEAWKYTKMSIVVLSNVYSIKKKKFFMSYQCKVLSKILFKRALENWKEEI